MHCIIRLLGRGPSNLNWIWIESFQWICRHCSVPCHWKVFTERRSVESVHSFCSTANFAQNGGIIRQCIANTLNNSLEIHWKYLKAPFGVISISRGTQPVPLLALWMIGASVQTNVQSLIMCRASECTTIKDYRNHLTHPIHCTWYHPISFIQSPLISHR